MPLNQYNVASQNIVILRRIDFFPPIFPSAESDAQKCAMSQNDLQQLQLCVYLSLHMCSNYITQAMKTELS